MRTIGHGRQFGFEEMVKCEKERLFRAKVSGSKRVQVIYLSKKHWLKQLSSNDVQAYIKLGSSYSNIQTDGQYLYAEMKSKNR